VVDDVDVG